MYSRCFERKVQSTEEFRGKWGIDGVEKTKIKKCEQEGICFFLDFFFFTKKKRIAVILVSTRNNGKIYLLYFK